jgi:hypothetical protein
MIGVFPKITRNGSELDVFIEPFLLQNCLDERGCFSVA